MGAWSHESFGNDDACDWIAELVDDTDLASVEEALDVVLEAGDDYLEAPEASVAIAAAEVIARLQGNWGLVDAYSETVDGWIKRTRLTSPVDLTCKAHRAIERILGEESELRELWDDSDDREQWLHAVNDLKSRLRI